MMFATCYSKEELFQIFDLTTLKNLYHHYIDTSINVKLTERIVLANVMHDKIPRIPMLHALLQPNDVVTDLEGNLYRIKEWNKGAPNFIPVVYDLQEQTFYSFNSFLFAVPGIGVGENIPKDLAMKLFRMGRNYNYFHVGNSIRKAGEMYVIDQEEAYRILHCDCSESLEALMLLLDD